MDSIHATIVGRRHWWGNKYIWVGICLLGIYAAFIFLDLPTPAGNQYSQNLPASTLLAWGAKPVPSARPADGWWDKTQALRGWSVFPEGWYWPKIAPAPWPHWLALVALGLAGATGLWWMERHARRSPRGNPAVYIGLLIVFSFLFQLGTLWLKSANAEQLLIDRIKDPDFTGYFNSALQIDDLNAFFAKYDSTLSSPSYCSHCRSHPPGPVLFYWLVMRAVDTMPETWQDGLAGLLIDLGHFRYPDIQPDDDIALVIGSNIILLAAATIAIPLYGLARRLGGRDLALPLAALGTVLPGLILMSPEFDQLYGTLAAWIFYVALRGVSATRHAGLWGLGEGLLLAFGLYWSFGLWVLLIPLVLMAWAVAAGLLGPHRGGSGEPGKPVPARAAIEWVLGLGLGLGLPWGLLWGVGGFPLLKVLRMASQDHLSGITPVRPFIPWLIFNLVDFFQFVGLPLVATTILTLFGEPTQSAISSARKSNGAVRFLSRLNIYGVLFWMTVAGLDISGTTRAEVGRLWIFLMPIALLAIYHAAGRGKLNSLHIYGLLASQFLVCLFIGGNWLTP